MYELFVKAKNKLSEGGFYLRKCVSSSPVVQGRINHQEQLQSRLTTLEEDESYAKKIPLVMSSTFKKNIMV